MGFFRRDEGPPPPPPVDPGELEQWMATLFTAGEYRPVWEHRLALGVGFSRGGMPEKTWFWLNAYPALAAIRGDIRWENPLGEMEYHPVVSTCAAWAEQAAPGLGANEDAAFQEIYARFFG